jgi:hypothetical protein
MARKKISLITVHILFVFLIKVIISPTPQTEIVYDKEPNYSSLPNEVPDLIAPFKELARFDEKIYKLKDYIGVLPYPEQYALLQAYKEKEEEDELFSVTTYEEAITKNGIFTKEIEAISDYVTEFEKKLAYGIGCIKSVTNKYFRDGKDNVEYQDKIYSNLNAILTAQGKVNQAQAQFIKELETILFQRRNLLLGQTTLNINQDTNTPESVPSLGYSDGEKNATIDAFVNFYKKQKKFTEELANNSMNAIINLSNMDGCRNYKDPNLNAGESSKGVEKPEIDYRKGRVQTGVNDEARIREDKRTTNGFLINGGFQLGFAGKGKDLTNIDGTNKNTNEQLKTINNCFGVFASGGQDDKDACRDVMIKKCGIDLDYQCKKSGFYDYVIANPVTIFETIEDIESYTEKDKLFAFIDKYFIQNSIAIKPSSIIGFNTIVQRLEKDLKVLPNKLTVINSDAQTKENPYSGAALYKINIFEATPNSSGDPSLKQTLMDEFLYNFLENRSSFYKIKYNILLCFILLCFL